MAINPNGLTDAEVIELAFFMAGIKGWLLECPSCGYRKRPDHFYGPFDPEDD